MLGSGEQIAKYMREKIDDDGDVFIYLELKGSCELDKDRFYNYYVKGTPRNVLMSIAEIVDRESKEMSLTFDEAIEVLKNMHQINYGKYDSKRRRRMENEWKTID